MNQQDQRSTPYADTEGQTRSQASKQVSALSDRMNPDFRNHLVACIGEFVGTFFFLFFALTAAAIANTALDQDAIPRLLYISLAFALSLLVNVWVWFRVSGGVFNPAVMVGLVLVGAIAPVRGACMAGAQITGAIASSAMLLAIFPFPLATVVTDLSPNISNWQGFLIEAFLTFQLTLTILLLAVEKHAATALAPIGIGLSLFIAELAGIPLTGGSLNPARSLGPAIIAGHWDHHWIYWVGPILGAVVAAGLYSVLNILNYETANPGQDASTPEGEVHLE